ncbi:DTX3L-like protein [Mya arenaria]|uniref:E3 ubiquitin-protein ligase n=1 Tax=Mya arenaria TaxID=6604 RepID=A0ABY7F8V8_MYAAR|nr:DTX3L-like protein [Mya arenaria]
MAGYLYLLSRKFDKGVSDVRSNLREIKHKHTFKRFEFKENRVILKCVFEDLEDVCEHQDEVTGSDDGSVNDVFEPTTEIQKERLTVEAELKRTKADLNRVEKERAIVQTKWTTIKELFNWTQPSGTVQVNRDYEVVHPIMKLIFTFPEGIQTSHHPSPGKSYKGGTFKGYLANNSEGLAVCMALKAEFSTGRMFTVGKNGKIVPNGVSLYDHAVYEYSELVGLTGSKRASYVAYIQKVKAELADKGITEAGTDQMKHLEETVTVDGLALLQAALSS